MQNDLLENVVALYADLPPVSCLGCGECCVSPTCTLVEFLFLMHDLGTFLSADEIQTLLLSPAVPNADYDGNLICKLLKGKQCAVHPVRTGACRLFGTSSALDRGVADLVVCRHGIESENRVDPAMVERWLQRLLDLNRRVYELDAAPYFLIGLNLECWLDVYFDDSLNFDIFINIRNAMQAAFDLSMYKPRYRPRTAIREKIDKISILSAMIGIAGAGDLRPLLLSIRDEYPLTGTYFHKEAQVMLDALDADSSGA